MSTQQHRIRQIMGGLESVKMARLVSSTRHCPSIRGKAPVAIRRLGPARSRGYTQYEITTRDSDGLSKWQVIACGSAQDVQAALVRMLR